MNILITHFQMRIHLLYCKLFSVYFLCTFYRIDIKFRTSCLVLKKWINFELLIIFELGVMGISKCSIKLPTY